MQPETAPPPATLREVKQIGAEHHQQADQAIHADEGCDADRQASHEHAGQALLQQAAMQPIERERDGGDEGDIGMRGPGDDEGAGAKDDRAKERHPAVAEKVMQVDIAGRGVQEGQDQIGEVQGSGGRQELFQRAQQRHVRQAEIMEGQRNASGVEEQIGEVEIGATRDQTLEIPGIPQ